MTPKECFMCGEALPEDSKPELSHYSSNIPVPRYRCSDAVACNTRITEGLMQAFGSQSHS